VCREELRYPKEVSEIGGVHYDPPLLRLTCLNPKDEDHSPQTRERLGLPPGHRDGLTFHYDQKHSKFVQVQLKALKSGHPVVNCRDHGRMLVTEITEASQVRVPKRVFEKLGSTFPIYRVCCRDGDSGWWISANQKKKIPYAFRTATSARN
jgi:hypothetical protein